MSNRAERLAPACRATLIMCGEKNPTDEQAMDYARDVLYGDADSRSLTFRIPPSVARSPESALALLSEHIPTTLAAVSVRPISNL